MDWAQMLLDARILNAEGADLGDVLSFNVMHGELVIITDMELEDGGDGPGGGEEVPDHEADLPLRLVKKAS